MQSVSLRIHVDAPVERVWNLISDHEGYIRLTDVTSAELLREGKVERNGIGALREIHFRGVEFVEEILVFDSPRCLEYKVVRCSLPIDHERGLIELAEHGNGTEIRWTTLFQFTTPVIGPLLDRVGRRMMQNTGHRVLLDWKQELESEKQR